MTVRFARRCALVLCLLVLAAACFAQATPAPAAPAAPAAAPAPTNLLPPHVVSCTPAANAANVDVNLTQISVTFDRPMKTAGQNGFGTLRWLGTFPAAKKALPTWNADGTVVSLPVKLDTDMTYAVTVNAAGGGRGRAGAAAAPEGFTDVNGAQALPFTWAFSTGARTAADFPACVASSDPAQAAADVDATRPTISVTFNRPLAPGELPLVALTACGAAPAVAPARGGGGHGHHAAGGGPHGLVSLSADRLTATIEVSLAPGTVYALAINDDTRADWKDTLGRPVLPYAWCFKTAGTPPAASAAGPAPGAPAAAPTK
jgi:hypothetical protein